MIRLDRRFRGRLIEEIIAHFDQADFEDFLQVELDQRLERFARGNRFDGQVLDTLNNAEQLSWLEDLLKKLRARRPGLVQLVDKIFAEYNEGLTWYSCDSPVKARFVGQMPFVDRNEFRSSIADLEGTSLNSVLFVKGELGAGKSYLWNYLHYLYRTHPQGNCVLIDLDDYGDIHSVGEKDLMTLILAKLGFGALAPHDETAQSFVRHEALIGQLTSRINERMPESGVPQDRFIVIDSLDNKCLEEDGLKLVEMLALQIGRGNVPGIRLILMGYDAVSPAHRRNNVHILNESINAIGHTELEEFFIDVAADVDAEIDQNIVQAAAARTLELASAEEDNQLHDQIKKVAATLFDPATEDAES